MTRIIMASDRVAWLSNGTAVDVARASKGLFGTDPQQLFDRWAQFRDWTEEADVTAGASVAPVPDRHASPVGRPRMVIAAGLNHPGKFASLGVTPPPSLGLVAKLPPSWAGPGDDIAIASPSVYAEVELALVIGRVAHRVGPEEALDHVAGATVALDIADAAAVIVAPAASDSSRDVVYFNPGKSLPGFCPLGPEVVTLDELGPLGDLALELDLDGEAVQRGHVRDLQFSPAEMVSQVSQFFPLVPGDVLLTGSPGWVDGSRAVSAGEELVARISGLGEQRHRIVSA